MGQKKDQLEHIKIFENTNSCHHMRGCEDSFMKGTLERIQWYTLLSRPERTIALTPLSHHNMRDTVFIKCLDWY